MLCFDLRNKEGRVCRVSESPTGSFNKILESIYHHYSIDIASNEGYSIMFTVVFYIPQIDIVIALGSRNNRYMPSETGHSKMELYYHSTSLWKTQNPYPYHNEIRDFEILPFLDGFIYSNSPDQIETSNPTDIWLKRYKLRVYPLGVMGLL